MGSVAKVFAQIEEKALTPKEIVVETGVSLSKVKEVLAFLKAYGFLEAQGPRVRIVREIAVLSDV